jgi:hypothetical protein
MAIPPKDRPLGALREETIDLLVVNYGHGRLSLEAFQRRLDQAMEATDQETLAALSADLDVQVDERYLERKHEELRPRLEPGDGEDTQHIISIVGGNGRSGAWKVPRELRLVTILGGTDLDFTDARFTHATTKIKVFCLFGGVEIGVPEGVNTTVNAACLLGGVEDKSPGTSDPDAPRLVIEGFVMFGGLDVKVRKTLRERMVAFADGLRTLFGR